MKKGFSLFFAVVLLASLVIPVFAAESTNDAVSPRYTYIIQTHADLSINTTTGISNSDAYLLCESGYTAEVECKLQRYTGTYWSTIKTWTASGSRYASINQDWAVSSGYTYRVYVTYRVRNSNGTLLETTTETDSYYYPPK